MWGTRVTQSSVVFQLESCECEGGGGVDEAEEEGGEIGCVFSIAGRVDGRDGDGAVRVGDVDRFADTDGLVSARFQSLLTNKTGYP